MEQNRTNPAEWPDDPSGSPLGDGRFAHATDRPASVDELGEVIARRAGEGFAVYPQGGRTSLDYGGIPARPGVAVDLRGLDRVIDYPAADMTITIEAGATLGRLRAILAEQGQRLALEAPFAEVATLGGIFATDASGPRRFGLGRARDQIIGIRYVDAQGQVIKGGGRVVKNVAGYDFPRLLTGSMGTLGVIAELTLKVRPMPAASALAWVRFRRLAEAAQALDRLNTSATRPIGIDLLNGPAAQLVGRVADLPVEEWVGVIGFEDNADSVAWQLDRLGLELGRTDLIVTEGDRSAPLWSALVDVQAAEPHAVSLKVNLRPSAGLSFLAKFDPAHWAIHAQAGGGIIRAHALDAPSLDELGPEVDRLRDAAVALGGNLTVPKCPTEWKERLRVWGHPREDWAMAERVKAALDPGGVLNPGRFVGKI